MNFTWDEKKRKSNLARHGFDFIDAMEVFTGAVVTTEDDRFDYGEQRVITIGMLKGRVVVIAHVERRNATRIISMRKATKNEQKIYFTEIADKLGPN